MTNTNTKNMTREQATKATDDIRATGKNLATARTKFAGAVKRAKDGNAHTALGFKSWTAYVAKTFTDMPGLAKADVEYLTAFMAGEGMSSRAVARVLGVSQSTAARMIRQAEETGAVDSERKVTGTDGKGQSAKGKGGKGRAKGAPAKNASAKGVPAKNAETPQARGANLRDGEVSLDSLTSAELGKVVLDALATLNTRWRNDGDETAEDALIDVLAMMDSHGINA